MDGMSGFPYPECPKCGAAISDMESHRQFHDGLAWLWRQVTDASDEEYERVMGEPAAVMLERMEAAGAEVLAKRDATQPGA